MTLLTRYNGLEAILCLILLLHAGSALGQKALHPEEGIPVTLNVCGQVFSPDKIKIALIDSALRRVVATVRPEDDGKSGKLVFKGIEHTGNLSLLISPNELWAFEIGYINTQRLMDVAKIEVVLNKIVFDHLVGWGLQLGERHNLIQIKFYSKKDSTYYTEYLYSLYHKMLPDDVRRTLRKCKFLKGELTPKLVVHG